MGLQLRGLLPREHRNPNPCTSTVRVFDVRGTFGQNALQALGHGGSWDRTVGASVEPVPVAGQRQ